MSEMVERVAMALQAKSREMFGEGGISGIPTIYGPWEGVSDRDKGYYRQYARAVISAMREPTEEMMTTEIEDGEPIGKAWLDDYSATRVWQCLIDGALKE